MRTSESDRTLPDEDLVARCRKGDERAFGLLVERHHASVYRLALSITSDPDLAQDVTQDAFLKAFRALDGFRGDAAFRTWLLTIAGNEARGALRKRRRWRETALDSVGTVPSEKRSPEDDAITRDAALRVRRKLDELPEKQRLAVTLRIDEDLSFREIGEVIGSSEGAARVNYFHGIRKLREWMS